MDDEKRFFLAENFRVRTWFCRRRKVVGTTAFLEGKMILTSGAAMRSAGARRIRPEFARVEIVLAAARWPLPRGVAGCPRLEWGVEDAWGFHEGKDFSPSDQCMEICTQLLCSMSTNTSKRTRNASGRMAKSAADSQIPARHLGGARDTSDHQQSVRWETQLVEERTISFPRSFY